MTDDEIIAVVTAHRDRQPIQRRGRASGTWADDLKPDWNFGCCDYRVKPAPQSLWVNLYDGLIPAAHETKEIAVNSASPGAVRVAVHFREVTDG